MTRIYPLTPRHHSILRRQGWLYWCHLCSRMHAMENYPGTVAYDYKEYVEFRCL